VTDGKIKIPTAPGLGLAIDPDIISKSTKVDSI
jgi:L-alanine-DL-glutamate epimerase-like enolase superfamily enzyme